MGLEIETAVWVGDKSGTCKVLLESGELICRGALRHRFPLTAMTELAVKDGRLSFLADGVSVSIELGDESEVWYQRIRNPRTRSQKLGLKPGQRVCVLGPAEPDVIPEVAAVTNATPTTRLAAGLDLVLFFVEEPSDLPRLDKIESCLNQGGCVWVLYPKGRSDLRHEEVVAAAKLARLSLGSGRRCT